jgi:acetyl-CoA acetyltransferase
MAVDRSLRGRYVIAGIGATAFGTLGCDTLTLHAQACARALSDANIGKDAVDALFVKAPTSSKEFMYGQRVADALGIAPRWGGAWDQGGAANITLIAFAIMAIEHGQCEVALVSFADNPRSASRAFYERARGQDAGYGWFAAMGGYAMLQRRHMIEHHTPREALGAVALAARRHGAANPHAQLRKPLTMSDYLASPKLVEPIHRDDACLLSDGGAALVVMSAERARQLAVPAAVPVLGFGAGQTSFDLTRRADLTTTCAVSSGRDAFEMAGISPRDVDVAQLYDCFTITVLMTLEDYGFCAKGRVAELVADGAIEIGGKLPINTAGGLLSETGMPGMQLIQEGVRQIRGSATLQVPGADVCLVSNQGGVMHTHSTLVLGST